MKAKLTVDPNVLKENKRIKTRASCITSGMSNACRTGKRCQIDKLMLCDHFTAYETCTRAGTHRPTDRSMVVDDTMAKGGASRRAPAASSASSENACIKSILCFLPACKPQQPTHTVNVDHILCQ